MKRKIKRQRERSGKTWTEIRKLAPIENNGKGLVVAYTLAKMRKAMMMMTFKKSNKPLSQIYWQNIVERWHKCNVK